MAEIHQYKFQAVAKYILVGERQKNLTDDEIDELSPVVEATINFIDSVWGQTEQEPYNVAPYAKKAYYGTGVWRFENGEVWREGIDKITE